MIQVFVMHKTLPGSMRFAAEGLGWKTTSEHTLLYFIGRQVQVLVVSCEGALFSVFALSVPHEGRFATAALPVINLG